MKRAIFLAALCAAVPAWAEPEAIVSIGGPITEIIYALNEEHRIVARDTTSVYPPQALGLPDVGYMRRLSAEGVLSLGPDLIIARDSSGPIQALDQLRAASVPMVFVKDGFSEQAVLGAISTIGAALGAEEKAKSLAADIKAQLARLRRLTSAIKTKKRVMFVLSVDNGRMNVAGRGTGADGIIALAGAQNVMSFDNYRLIEAESVISAAPDVILIMQPRGNHSTGADDILALAAVKLTPAGQNAAVHTIPGAALGFGPRTAEFGHQLYELLYADQ